MAEISNNQDVLDSRDIQERIDELEALEERDEADQEELDKLTAFKGEADTSEWDCGVTFISEDYFEEYCEELVSDIGDFPNDMPGYIVIDWEATAFNLRVDYSEVDFDGIAYLFR